MNFQEFCDGIANPEIIHITHNEDLPESFVEPLNVLVNMIRLKLTKADSIKITFIQNKFDDMEQVCDILENKYNGEVHDSLATILSHRLYGKDYNHLSCKEMSIIKVLAIYLMIQLSNHN